MSDHIHQSLSHLMDSEADELELRRILKACDEQEGQTLTDTWHRYHLVRSVLHKELEQKELVDIADRIALALEQEPEPAQRPPLAESWRSRLSLISDTWLAKGAIAASVAAAIVLLLPDGNPQALSVAEQGVAEQRVAGSNIAQHEAVYQQTLSPPTGAQGLSGVQLVSAGGDAETPMTSYTLVDNQKQRQDHLIRGYLMQHSEYVSASGTHGMMPMARVSGYQTGQ